MANYVFISVLLIVIFEVHIDSAQKEDEFKRQEKKIAQLTATLANVLERANRQEELMKLQLERISYLEGIINNRTSALQGHHVGRWQCVAVPYIQHVSVAASVYSLVAIGIDRFQTIARPTKPKISWRAAKVMITCVWVFALLYALTLVQDLNGVSSKVTNSTSTDEGDDDEESEEIYQYCNMMEEDSSSDFFVRLADSFILLLIPMVVLGVLYGVIIRRLWYRPSPVPEPAIQKAAKKKVIKMLVVVICVFCVSWTPFHLYECIVDGIEYFEGHQETEAKGKATVRQLKVAATLLALANSWINPILYVILNSNIRKEITAIFRKRTSAVAPTLNAPLPQSEVMSINMPQPVSSSGIFVLPGTSKLGKEDRCDPRVFLPGSVLESSL